MSIIADSRQCIGCAYCGKRSYCPAHNPPQSWQQRFGYNFCSKQCVYKYAAKHVEELIIQSDDFVFSSAMLISLIPKELKE